MTENYENNDLPIQILVFLIEASDSMNHLTG